jgi:hypothetical protein
MAPIVKTRPVWYPDDESAVSHESVAVGEAAYGRPPDAWGLYLIEPDGRLTHLFDTLSSSYLKAHGTKAKGG